MTVPPQQQLVVLVATSKGNQTRNTIQDTWPGHTAHGTDMRPWLQLLLLLSLDCRATGTVSSMNLASGVRDAATRASAFCARAAAYPEKKVGHAGLLAGVFKSRRNCCGRRDCCSPSVRVASRVDGAEPGHPPTPGLRSIRMPYHRNKLAVTVTAVHGTELEV